MLKAYDVKGEELKIRRNTDLNFQCIQIKVI